MVNELAILERFKKVIEEQLNNYLDDSGEDGRMLPSIDCRNVTIDFPDVDQMPKSVMFYLQPNYSNYETLSTESDLASFTISLFVICKRDKQENLTKKIYHYMNAVYKLFRTNISLDGMVDFVDITDADFYPAVEGSRNVQAVELSISIRYTKDW